MNSYRLILDSKRTLSLLVLTVMFSVLPGCIAVGNGRGARPTIADELKALKAARDAGELTCDEYNMGVAALHRPVER